jgi:hypothetical protein
MGLSATLKGLNAGESSLRGVGIDPKGAIFVGDKGLRLWLFALTVLWVLTFAAVLALSETLQVRRLKEYTGAQAGRAAR